MEILFIHANFPGQFMHLARVAGADTRHQVMFLTKRADAANDAIEGVALAHFEEAREVAAETHHYLQSSEWAVLNGQAVLRSVAELLEKGFKPVPQRFAATSASSCAVRMVVPAGNQPLAGGGLHVG